MYIARQLLVSRVSWTYLLMSNFKFKIHTRSSSALEFSQLPGVPQSSLQNGGPVRSIRKLQTSLIMVFLPMFLFTFQLFSDSLLKLRGICVFFPVGYESVAVCCIRHFRALSKTSVLSLISLMISQTQTDPDFCKYQILINQKLLQF